MDELMNSSKGNMNEHKEKSLAQSKDYWKDNFNNKNDVYVIWPIFFQAKLAHSLTCLSCACYLY